MRAEICLQEIYRSFVLTCITDEGSCIYQQKFNLQIHISAEADSQELSRAGNMIPGFYRSAFNSTPVNFTHLN